jgi:hypothetical protein
MVVTYREKSGAEAEGRTIMRSIMLLGACGLIAACTSGAVTVPRDAVLYEVPRQPAALPQRSAQAAPVAQAQRQAAGVPPVAVQTQPAIVAPQEQPAEPAVFEERIARVLEEPVVQQEPPVLGLPAPIAAEVPVSTATASAGVTGSGTPLDDDRLNLNEYTLEQQRIDAAIAERELEEARRQLVIVEPDASVPQAVEGANIVLFAKSTTHAVGERRYARPVTAALNRGAACRRFATADEAQRFFLANGGPERDPHGLDPDGDGFACGWDPEPFRRLGL